MYRLFPFSLLALQLVICCGAGIKGGVGDLALYQTAVLHAFHGEFSRVYADAVSLFYYGPFSLFILSPLTLVSFQTGIYLAILIHALAFLVVWFVLYELYPVMRSRHGMFVWGLVWLVSLHPIHSDFRSLNVQLPLASALLLAEWLYQKKNLPFLSGFLAALTVLVKVFPVFILLYYFLFRGKQVRRGVIAGFLTGILAPLAAFGFENGVSLHQDFVRNLFLYPVKNGSLADAGIQCLPSLFTVALRPFLPSRALAGVILFFQAGLAGGFFYWVWQNRQRASSSLFVWAFAMALMVFLNPSSRHDYFVFYLPAFASIGLLWRENYLSLCSRGAVLVSVILSYGTTQAILGRFYSESANELHLLAIGIIFLLVPFFAVLRDLKGAYANA